MDQNIKVDVKGLVPTPTGCGIFLSDAQKVIAIFVDHNVAAAVTMLVHKVKKPRPLTHDLIQNILAGFSVTVEKVVINDLKNETFYARLYLSQKSELGVSYVEVDSRPSDAITLALQQQCPVFVARSVWEKAEDMSWALEEATSKDENDDDLKDDAS